MHRCRSIGIHVPIIPGILPIQSYRGFKKLTDLCRLRHIPASITRRLEALRDDQEAVEDLGVEVAIQMCRELLRIGVPEFHFYTLNADRAVLRVIQTLHRPPPAAAAALEEEIHLGQEQAHKAPSSCPVPK